MLLSIRLLLYHNLVLESGLNFRWQYSDPIPNTVGEVYAQIKIASQEQGMSLGECDLWIAATALALDAILVASDSDYERIIGLGLRLEDWKN